MFVNCIQKPPISVIHVNLEIYIKLKLNLKIKILNVLDTEELLL